MLGVGYAEACLCHSRNCWAGTAIIEGMAHAVAQDVVAEIADAAPVLLVTNSLCNLHLQQLSAVAFCDLINKR